MAPIVRAFTPTDAQLDELASICGRAFLNDPFFVAIANRDIYLLTNTHRQLCTIAKKNGAAFYGTFDDQTGRIKAAAIVWPEGKHPEDFLEPLDDSSELWDRMRPGAAEWIDEQNRNKLEPLQKRCLISHSTHYHVELIVTDVHEQRKGYGSALVNAIIGKARQDRKSISLGAVSGRNSEFYKKFGFEVLEHAELESFDDSSKFSLHVMGWRPSP